MRVHPDGAHPPDGRAEADGRLDGGRAGLEAEGDVARDEVAGRAAEDVLVHRDHAAAHLVEREASQALALRVEDADAARAERLVRARGEEVDVELPHVDGQVRERLRRVEEDGDAARVGERTTSATGAMQPGDVRDVPDRDEAASSA